MCEDSWAGLEYYIFLKEIRRITNTRTVKKKNYLLQLGCYPVAVVILHVNKTLNWLLLNLSREGYMRSM